MEYRVTRIMHCVLCLSGLLAGIGCESITREPKAVPTAPLVTRSLVDCTGLLAIDSFSVLEVFYQGRFFYAPQVHIKETTGAGGGDVLLADFQLPGFGKAPAYDRVRHVEAGASRALFREVYGDFEYTIDNGGGQADPGPATANITVFDRSGRHALTVTGPIVPSGFPSTYTGGKVEPDAGCR